MALLNLVFFIYHWVDFDYNIFDLLAGFHLCKTGKSPRSTHGTLKHQRNDLHSCKLGFQFLVFY